MGESIKRNLSQRAGLKELANWLDSSFRDTLLTKVSDQLVITQDLRPFQRLIRFRSDAISSIDIGEHPEHVIVVPVGEAWRVWWISIDHSNSVPVDYTVRLEVSSTSERIDLLRKNVQINRPQSLFPGQQITIAATFNDYTHPEVLEVFANDEITVFSEPFSANARASLAGIRYELIPPALDFQLGEQWTGTVVP